MITEGFVRYFHSKIKYSVFDFTLSKNIALTLHIFYEEKN